MTTQTLQTSPTQRPSAGNRVSNLAITLIANRTALLGLLIVIVLVVMTILDQTGWLSGSYDADYLSAALITAVPLAMLGLAELLVILSGRGGIDLSVGAIVSLCGIVFGYAYGIWELSLPVALLITVLAGAICGAINGVLIAYIGFPPLIATLATLYAFKSLALVISGQRPISAIRIQDFFSAADSVEIPVIGAGIPDVPLGIFTFLIPTAFIVWLLLNRTTYGRRLFAVGTNDVAAKWAGVDVASNRMTAYLFSGIISALVAVVTVAQFASARPDAGVSGSGMALPAITIAVLGGVAITGGIGKVSGVILATLLIVWLNAGILLAFAGNEGTQYQLLALGVLLIGAALLNNFTRKRFGRVA
ncbi:ABC transporter permease [Microbacterium sp. SCN 69-37]|uniref:ABC transporter permease n=1 Tax=Microbacterium sp. SCN 69-37 TaxID=1660115 RepID=UPI00086D2E99|nr:ABC transporter permease [Microbacterium sp. SCN 69-37]ODT25981.1 MAG: serine protease [Microbacterium sp. SCN 69-37]